MKTGLITALVLTLAAPLMAQDHGQNTQPYKGLQTREIKSLSAGDIDDLLNGRGWGLALPAELNGLPGPKHLLEMQADLNLSAEQVIQITAIFDAMQAEAIPKGQELVTAERALDQAFADRSATLVSLRNLIETAEAARADLRFIHLSRHLQTAPILTEAQISKYNILRGYADGPCANIPQGHDPAMWKRHNNCS